MLRNILRSAWRNLFKTRLHSFINITGLSIGITVALLIGLYIRDERSYDTFNDHYHQVGRIMQTTTLNGDVSTSYSEPIPLAAELRSHYGELFQHVSLSQWTRNHILSVGEKKFTQKGKFMEPEGPEMLGLKMVEGTKTGLQDPASILISASAAKALFGQDHALDKILRIDNKASVKVTGIYEDIPRNSQYYNLQFISSFELCKSLEPDIKNLLTDWGWDAIEIIVQLKDNVTMDQASARIAQVKYDKVRDNKALETYKPVLFISPLERWHLYSEFRNGVNTGGRIRFLWMFGIIGGFVLALACINFMNLSTARSHRRAKEVGIRKAIGSSRGQLIAQFFGESLLAATLAFLLALLLTAVALPIFNTIIDKSISLPWNDLAFWTCCLSCIALTGLFAGVYPALYLSSFQPIKVLKGLFKAGSGTTISRKALVVLQFSVSITLIIGTIIVYRQVQFGKDRPIGYDKEGLISLQMNTADYYGKEAALRNALINTGAVLATAEASSPATWVWRSDGGYEWQGKDPNRQAEFGSISVTHDYGKTLGWHFKAGRDFSRDYPTDSVGFVLNEAAVRYMDLKDPVGQTVGWGHTNYHIIGVIDNMLMESPYDPVRPTVYYMGPEQQANFIFIRLKPGRSLNASLDQVKAVFSRYIPSAPFDYKFVDEDFADKFGDEERIGRLAMAFTILAIFISCMGLFGMASFMAEQRIKEIGMRKILGASIFSLWRLLSKEFMLLVMLSLLIACPLAYYFMHDWLQQYAYHADISWWIFAAAGSTAFVITLATVSYQALKTALANPAKSLRSE